SGTVQPDPPLPLVLVHDRAGVAMRQAMLVRQPVRALIAAQERRSRFEASEPLSKVTTGNHWDAGDEVFVHLRRVGQRQVAPPGERTDGARSSFSRDCTTPGRLTTPRRHPSVMPRLR